jgi:hypothetical protein
MSAKVECADNMNAPAQEVRHADLPRVSDESAFRSTCPVCSLGYLFVRRDQRTMALENVDRCTWCAQMFVYTDTEIAGCKLVEARVTATEKRP